MNLKALSEKLGLSPTTVSRALNGYPEVSDATRRRVLDAARRYHYRPNTRAKSLATGRTMSIGHVIPLSTKHEMVNPIFADFIAGAGETYSRAGYDMSLSVVRDEDEARVYRELAQNRSVDGIIVHGPRVDDPRIGLLQELGLPFVVHGRASETGAGYSWLDVNNRRAFARATRFLLDLGHRRIGLVNGIETMSFAHRRRLGHEDALSAAGIGPDPALMRAGEMTEPYGHAAAREMLELDRPPTAFLTSSFLAAMGVRRALEDRGLKPGRDVSILTHDDVLSYLANEGDVPLYTAVRSSVRAAGRRCAEMLLDIVTDPDHAPIQEIWEAELVLGQSTGPAPA
ncbi:LacI family DNA-binding transcriptional regulator [Rhodovulum sp. YNF3179]|uniref:LacI family DNA-binding transcriptional regulator n=1 Tax=Rhodovulum sp. YNF3179 TaxID=3425127 RepID=UPI003D346CE7